VRASRLVSILLLLQTRGRMTAPRLAEELEVSVRTIYRDLQALGEAGVPVYTEPGPNGGCSLVDGYRTRLTGLTPHEAEALFLSGVPAATGDLGLGTVVAAAQLKVLAALPPELRSRATRIRDRFHLDAPGWWRRAEDVPHLAELSEAVWDDRRVELRYERRDRVVQRTVDPFGLVLKGGVWYLVARARDGLRTYRVSRIRTLTVLDAQFDRPEGFDLGAHWDASSGEFQASLLRHEVTARVSPAGLAALAHAVDPLAARLAVASAGPPDAGGWVTVTIPTEALDYAHNDLLRLGTDIEVLAPDELRDRFRDTAETLAARYSRQ
jgi:predicted DNA-binding transcriptional regulator YafY